MGEHEERERAAQYPDRHQSSSSSSARCAAANQRQRRDEIGRLNAPRGTPTPPLGACAASAAAAAE